MKSILRTGKVIGALCAMLMLILDPKTALAGAAEGIDLCICTVIPALFPFVVLSGYLTGNFRASRNPVLTGIGSMLKIPPGAEGIFLTGLLGGYPVGAQAIAQAYNCGTLSKEQARRMLGFCSNAGPAFLFGMLAPYFSGVPVVWVLWLIHVLSAVAVGCLLPAAQPQSAEDHIRRDFTFPAAVERGVKIMGMICGWVILFRIALVFLDRWALRIMPAEMRVLISGALELTNGCVGLSAIAEEHIRFLLAVLFLNFGGICVGMQTVSVTAALGTGWYFPGKLLQTGIGLLLCGVIIPGLYPGCSIPFLIPFSLLWILLMMISLYFPKITVAFSGFSVYNKENMTK